MGDREHSYIWSYCVLASTVGTEKLIEFIAYIAGGGKPVRGNYGMDDCSLVG